MRTRVSAISVKKTSSRCLWAECPMMISRCSSIEWSSSSKITAKGSSKTVRASSKLTLCFLRFDAALSSSHANLSSIPSAQFQSSFLAVCSGRSDCNSMTANWRFPSVLRDHVMIDNSSLNVKLHPALLRTKEAMCCAKAVDEHTGPGSISAGHAPRRQRTLAELILQETLVYLARQRSQQLVSVLRGLGCFLSCEPLHLRVGPPNLFLDGLDMLLSGWHS